MLEINIKDIVYGNEHRPISSTDLSFLKESIEKNELLNPIVVRKKLNKYFLLDGRRRIEAYKALGRETIPAVIKE
jgi:ParB family chromosome partitioning protein